MTMIKKTFSINILSNEMTTTTMRHQHYSAMAETGRRYKLELINVDICKQRRYIMLCITQSQPEHHKTPRSRPKRFICFYQFYVGVMHAAKICKHVTCLLDSQDANSFSCRKLPLQQKWCHVVKGRPFEIKVLFQSIMKGSKNHKI